MSGLSPESLYLYLVDKISGIMLQRFEKSALNLFHRSGGSFAECHSNDILLQSANMKFEKAWAFPKEHYFSGVTQSFQ